MIAALANPVRTRILQMTWDAERSAGEIAAGFDMTFGGVSQHLAVLLDAGLLTVRREGRSRLYKADRAALGPLAAALEAMWSDKLGTLKALAEAEQRRLNRRHSTAATRKRRAAETAPEPTPAAAPENASQTDTTSPITRRPNP